MDESRTQEARERAGGVCEYCRLAETAQDIPFEVEHVIPEQHGGKNTLSNILSADPMMAALIRAARAAESASRVQKMLTACVTPCRCSRPTQSDRADGGHSAYMLQP